MNSEITNCRDQNCSGKSGKSAMTRKVVIFFISRPCNSRKTPHSFGKPRNEAIRAFFIQPFTTRHVTIFVQNFRHFPKIPRNPFFQIFIASHVSLSDVQTANWPCLTSEPALTHTHTHTIIHFLSLSLRFSLYISMCSEYMPICAGLVLLVC